MAWHDPGGEFALFLDGATTQRTPRDTAGLSPPDAQGGAIVHRKGSMDRHTKSDLKEVVRFLILLAVIFVLLALMAFVLGYIWSKVPIPKIDNGE